MKVNDPGPAFLLYKGVLFSLLLKTTPRNFVRIMSVQGYRFFSGKPGALLDASHGDSLHAASGNFTSCSVRKHRFMQRQETSLHAASGNFASCRVRKHRFMPCPNLRFLATRRSPRRALSSKPLYFNSPIRNKPDYLCPNY